MSPRDSDFADRPSSGVIAWMLFYLLLLYALLAWGITRRSEAVPPAHAGGTIWQRVHER